MKKILSIVSILVLSVMLIGCKKNEIIYDDNLEELTYFSNLDEGNPEIIIEVQGYGTMYAQLFPEVAPNTVANFISYIMNGDFEGSSFHRIIKGFMIQGGIVENTNDAIKGEFSNNGFENNLAHSVGVLSMARTNNPNSATSQFFVMHQNSPHLNYNYAAFGGLVSGFEVLNEIANVKTNYMDAPIEPVVITSIKINLNKYKIVDVVYN